MRTIATILLAGILGSVITLGVIGASLAEWFKSWEDLGSPPAKAIRIYDARPYAIWVQTDDGSVFVYSDATLAWDITEPPQPEPSAFSGKCVPARQPPRVAGAVSVVEVCDYWGPAVRYVQYALTRDGAIKRWVHSPGEYDLLALIVLPSVGGLVSMAVAAVAMFFRWFHRITTAGRLTPR